MAQKWNELPDIPLQHSWESVARTPIMQDKNTMIAMSDDGDVCTYTMDSQQWEKIRYIPVNSNDFSVEYHKQTNKLYLVGGLNALYSLCIKTGKVEQYHLSAEIDNGPATSLINGELHIIGGYKNGKHFVWDNNKKQLKLLHSIQESNKGIQDAALIHIPSQNKLLLLGGYDQDVDSVVDTMRVYSISDNEWKGLLNQNGDEIKLPLAVGGFGYILTRDERYVVIFGGTSGSHGGEEMDIYYLDLRTLKWAKSLVECPVNNEFMSVLTDYDDVHIFPRYMRDKKLGHWRIGVKDIIPEYGFELICGYVRLNCDIDFSVDLIKLIHKLY